jgi:hypothetical protein
MATDYISTVGWNDPLNAWPYYSQVNVSTFILPVTTLSLNAFDPEAGTISYVNGGISLSYNNALTRWTLSNTAWSLSATGGRGLPLTTATPGVSSWSRASGTPGPSDTVTIAPVVNSLTNWTKRAKLNSES